MESIVSLDSIEVSNLVESQTSQPAVVQLGETSMMEGKRWAG